MCPCVRVPVLSVTSTSTSPRSSMVMSFLTRTFFLANSREPADSEVLTRAGSSCGVMPMATEKANKAAVSQLRPMAMLTMRMLTVRTMATRIRKLEYFFRPFWKSVSSRSTASRDAMWPSSACLPVATTTPTAEPSLTMVPMRAQEARLSTFWAPGVASTVFSAGLTSPVRIDSSQEKSLTEIRRMSAGTIWPMCKRTTSPGTSSAVVTSFAAPSRSVTAL